MSEKETKINNNNSIEQLKTIDKAELESIIYNTNLIKYVIGYFKYYIKEDLNYELLKTIYLICSQYLIVVRLIFQVF